MEKKILAIIFMTAILVGCEVPEYAGDQEIFDVDIFVDRSKLMRNGFIQSEDEMELSKRVKGYTVSYDYLPETQVIYTRCVTIKNVATDSLSFRKWLNENEAVMPSNWLVYPNGTRKTYVQHMRSGLIFMLYRKGGMLIIYFDLPDVKGQIRSLNRTIDKNGKVTIKSPRSEISREPDLSN
jgi:hypothetical protein